jgi:hypothetical protein
MRESLLLAMTNSEMGEFNLDSGLRGIDGSWVCLFVRR